MGGTGDRTIAEEVRFGSGLLGSLEFGEHMLEGAPTSRSLEGHSVASIGQHAFLAAPPSILDLEAHELLALEVNVVLHLVACAAEHKRLSFGVHVEHAVAVELVQGALHMHACTVRHIAVTTRRDGRPGDTSRK